MNNFLHGAPSHTKIREELVDMFLKDLLGPVGGASEEIDEAYVRERYLIGMLAPKNQEFAAEESEEFAEGGKGTIEDGKTESSSPPARTLYPSSFGMTVSIDGKAASIRITAKWGHYDRVKSNIAVDNKGMPKLVWKRNQREGISTQIPLRPEKISWIPDPEFPDVRVEGIIRKRDDFWIVTLFLVNNQHDPKRLRDTAWLFQPELIVQSPDDAPIFRKKLSLKKGTSIDPLTAADDLEAEMLYRHNIEFAVGHGVAVHASCPEGVTDRATQISTRVAPMYETPKSSPPSKEEIPLLSDVSLDMKELGETPTAELSAKLRPIVIAYKDWIEKREEDLAKDELKPFKDAGENALKKCRIALQRIEEGLNLLATEEIAAEAFRFANQAMHQQRIRSIYALDVRRGDKTDLDAIDVAKNRSWYPFQLAFILLNLPGITKLDHKDRTGGERQLLICCGSLQGGAKRKHI